MALRNLTATAVEKALNEFDQVGRDVFLARYGFSQARRYFLVRGESRYDSKAIAGAAHGYLGDGYQPLVASDFSGGESTVRAALVKLGFNVQNAAGDPGNDRNPTWTRDELILALDLYMTNPVSPPGKSSKAVIDLSETLNRLGNQLRGSVGATYRNPAGVYMKMMNLRAHDPAVLAAGKVGLSSGGKGDELVWAEFAHRPEFLRTVADAIRTAVVNEGEDFSRIEDDDQMVEAPEGRVLTRLHRTRERNRKLIDTKKASALRVAGKLVCEVCNFDFGEKYGPRGTGFIEAHHTKPVHMLPEGGKTHVDDLALVCSNCHRMIHASRPWLSVGELKAIIR